MADRAFTRLPRPGASPELVAQPALDPRAEPAQAQAQAEAAEPRRPVRAATGAGPGRPLPEAFRGAMERSFGADFGGVRVHTDAGANASNGLLQARAFTRGQDLFFRRGEYDHTSTAGRELIAHELTHVVQQRAGRVPGPQRQGAGAVPGLPATGGVRLSVDTALEAEADAAGARAARGEPAGVAGAAGAAAGDAGGTTAGAGAQPKLGLELEMLVLTDIAGRPAPEKVELGTYGNLDLVVDRSGTLKGVTPTRSALASYRSIDIPEHPPKKGSKRVGLGAYDLPKGYESRRSKPGVGNDPRPVRGTLLTLAEQGITRPTWQQRVLNQWIKDYIGFATNWEPDLAIAALTKIIRLGPKLALKAPTLAQTIGAMVNEATLHRTAWGRSNLSPRNNADLMREISPVGQNNWQPKHPVAEGQTGEGYDSIVEIVTKAYDPETEDGSHALLGDMAKAVELAGKIETATGGFAHRVPLKEIGGVTPKARQAFVGSENVSTGGPQRTDASIQATMAIELKEIFGFFMAGMGGFEDNGFGPREFSLKHQSDVDVAREVGRRAPSVAAKVVGDLQPKSGMPNDLLGLFTLIAQYLVMGALFESPDSPQLDKNAVALLSRTDLAKIYRRNVAQREKDWIAQRLPQMKDSLLRHSGRGANDLLLTPESQPPLPQVTRTITCGTFIDNIFGQESDGFTPHLDEGIFKQMGPERIPGGGGIHHDEERTAPVFELRNMIPRAGDRFTKDQWVPLTADLVTLLTRLNLKGFWT